MIFPPGIAKHYILSNRSTNRKADKCRLFLMALAIGFTQPIAAGVLNDSIPVKPYRTVQIFDNSVEMIIPWKFRKVKEKNLKNPDLYSVAEKTGYHGKKGYSMKFFLINEDFPADELGIEIWYILERLTVRFEKRKYFESGYIVVGWQRMLRRKQRDVYFVKFAYLNSKKVTEYMLTLCVEKQDKLLVGYISSPQNDFIDTFEKDFFGALRFNEK